MLWIVIDGALRAFAVAASAIIVLSFALFAVEEVRYGSERQQSAIVDPGSEEETQRAADHTWAREAIDDANDFILKPFAGVVGDRQNVWALRGIPALLGLAIYGFGFALLARLFDTRQHRLLRRAPAPQAKPAAAASKPPPGS